MRAPQYEVVGIVHDNQLHGIGPVPGSEHLL
jgi:hypothetical protein